MDLHHNYLESLSGVLPAWIIKLANRPSRVIHIDPQAVVVPGLAGMLLSSMYFVDITAHLSDAHAHIIENGFMMELPLAGTQSIQGHIQSSKLDEVSNRQIYT